MYYNLLFKDSCSLVYFELMFFHDMVICMLLFISLLVLFSLAGVCLNSSISSYFLEKKVLEMVWTMIPAVILLFLSFPSLGLLYHIDSPLLFSSKNIVKVMGHQWYWEYKYMVKDMEVCYNSFLEPINNLKPGGYRLLETDKPLIVNHNDSMNLNGITEDVIHSWSCNSLGVKFDVMPGRLNSFKFIPLVLGVFYGQCSEMCGAKHSFMPMEVEVMKMVE